MDEPRISTSKRTLVRLSLHAFARRLYPELQDGGLPTGTGWLEALTELGIRSADALQSYFVVVTGFGDSRRTFVDD